MSHPNTLMRSGNVVFLGKPKTMVRQPTTLGEAQRLLKLSYKTSAEDVVFLATAAIMAHQPTTLSEAETLLELNYQKPAKNGYAEQEREHIRAHLSLNGLPDPSTYNLFQITHNGTLVDFKLKCLLVMGMCRLTQVIGDAPNSKVLPYLRGFAMAFVHFDINKADDKDPLAELPKQLRVAQAS